ncbi:MAG TPA: Ig-like domain-containing protein [Candidatus Acidoferrales bacterium]|nr:Ig-like domain-containing protein [Candidatus Acidoferrales bacterium]
MTFTATVTPVQNGGPTVTGTVQFVSNGSNIGNAVNVSNGQAQFQTTTLPVGSDQITAAYSGDGNYSSSSSSAITETVNPAPSFTISANPTTIPVTAPGGSGSSTFTFTGQNGFSSGGNVAISASTSGLPFGANCGFTTSTINIPTNGTAMATYNCTTTAGSSAITASRNRPGVFGPRTAVPILALACVLALELLALGQRKGQLRWAGLAAFALFLIVVSASCGGGSGGGGGGGNQGAPIADTQMTAMVTINNVTENVTVFLNVE